VHEDSQVAFGDDLALYRAESLQIRWPEETLRLYYYVLIYHNNINLS